MSALSILERYPGSNNVDSTTNLMQLYEKATKADKNIILSKTLRALMLRKFISGNEMINFHQTNNEFDETLCSEVVAFAKNIYSMEQNQSEMKHFDLNLMLKKVAATERRCDLVTRVRLENLSVDAGQQEIVNVVEDERRDPYDYYEKYFQNMQNRFGCSRRTSCSIEGGPIMTNGIDENHSSDEFERSLKQVLHASQDMYSIYENYQKETNLSKFANEINFVHNLFDQLKQKMYE